MIKDLEAVIGYRFRNISLLQNALTHSSYANERWHNSLLSNERLEFLGDSVLGMLVAEYLYRNFPNRPEGELTRMRADMVCETTLAGAANRIGLGNHLLLGHGEEQGGGRSRDSILADAMESVIAACFLDGGLDAALRQRVTALVADAARAKTLVLAVLIALFKQHLHAEADTEERLFLCSLQHRLRQTGVGQSRHRIRKRADTGQDNARRVLDHVHRSRDFIFITQVIERVVYAHQIACAIIYDCNITHR